MARCLRGTQGCPGGRRRLLLDVSEVVNGEETREIGRERREVERRWEITYRDLGIGCCGEVFVQTSPRCDLAPPCTE